MTNAYPKSHHIKPGVDLGVGLCDCEIAQW
jgi:hypothetical protein